MRALILCFGWMLLWNACNSNRKSTPEIQKLEWLIGTWSTNAMGKEILESWKQMDDSTLVGASYFINGEDTLLSEQMEIQERFNGTYFSTQLVDQNDGQIISFKLNRSDDQAFYFRNDQHDFPQQVVYTHPKTDSLWAYIDGNLNGQYNRVDFKMKRTK